MKLYFETQAQLALFLMTCCAGFAAGLTTDLLSVLLGGRLRALFDVAGFLIAFFLLTAYLLLFSQASLRLYDFLGLAVGLTLYTLGLKRIILSASHRAKARIQAHQEKKSHTSNQQKDSTDARRK